MYIRQALKISGGSMMVNSFSLWLSMNLPARLITLRKGRGLSQQAMADAIGIHVNSLKKYEAGQAQPSLDALRKIATTLHTSTDFLLFDDHERGPSDDLRLQFEAVSQFPEEERKIVKALLEGMIIKYQTKQLVGNLSS
jgi:transcriptional regulator with XRE-family HTH domain